MRVVAPFTDIAPETVAALDATGRPWEAWQLTEDDDYWTLLAYLWSQQEPFVVVEHDIVVRPDTIDALEECPGEWCGFSAPYFIGDYVGLGCVKFAASVQQRVPALFVQIANMSDPNHPPRHWCRIDAWLQSVLTRADVPLCRHGPPVGHLSTDPSHGCAGLAERRR